MSGDKKLARYVHVADDNGDMHVFGPEDEVPDWAVAAITNPAAWSIDDEDADAESYEEPVTEPDPEDEDPEDDAPAYDSWLKADLEAEIEKRNAGREADDAIEVEAPGNKPELVAALEADDAALAGD